MCFPSCSTGLVLPWRWLAVAGEVPVLLMLILLCFMPNSPRYLITQDKRDEACRALKWLRGPNADYMTELNQIERSVNAQVNMSSFIPRETARTKGILSFRDSEQAFFVLNKSKNKYRCTQIESIRRETLFTRIQTKTLVSSPQQVGLQLSDLKSPFYYKPILISAFMRFLQQMTGITPILVYLEPIFLKTAISLVSQTNKSLHMT